MSPYTHSKKHGKLLNGKVFLLFTYLKSGGLEIQDNYLGRCGREKVRTTDLVYVKNFHEAKLQALVKMHMTHNQPKTFKKRKNFSRTEQRYVSRTTIKISTTDTRLDLFTAS